MRIFGSSPQLPDPNSRVDKTRSPSNAAAQPDNARATARFNLPEKIAPATGKRVARNQGSEPVVYDVIRAANAVAAATGMSAAQASDIRGELVGRMSTAYARQALAVYEENQNIETRDVKQQAAKILGGIDLFA